MLISMQLLINPIRSELFLPLPSEDCSWVRVQDVARGHIQAFKDHLVSGGYSLSVVCSALDDPTKTEHLLALDDTEKRLHFFEANLLEEVSFDSAIHGCDGVFHTASPVIVFSTNFEAGVIDPAVKGTLNVLASCAKAPSLKRVIFTSSTPAVTHTETPLRDDTVIDETWFSSPGICKRKIGGLKPIHPNGRFGRVHVKDVAEAHIRALDFPSANGRYILSETAAHLSEIVQILHELYPSLKLPHKCEDDEPPEPNFRFSKEKAKALGIEYVPLKTALQETVECLKEKFKISV